MDARKRLHKPSLDPNKKQTPNPNHNRANRPSQPHLPAPADPGQPSPSVRPVQPEALGLHVEAGQELDLFAGV